jgi:DNA-binding NarL/FixJ family response regulator
MQILQNISEHEKKILCLLSQGKQNKYLADTLCLSEHTIKNHKANLCRKLNLNSTTELYLWAVKNVTTLQNEGEDLG